MIKRGSFIVFLFLFEDVLSKINILSNNLQQKQATLGKAVNLVNGVIKTFENNRNNETFNGVWTEISSYAKKLGISLEIGLYNLNFYTHIIACYNFLFFCGKVQRQNEKGMSQQISKIIMFYLKLIISVILKS